MNGANVYSNVTTTLNKQTVEGFKADATRLKTEFIYVFNQETGEYKKPEHKAANEVSVAFDPQKIEQAKSSISTSVHKEEIGQGHRHPTHVNGVKQGANRYRLSDADKNAIKHRYNQNTTKQAITETIGIHDKQTDSVEFVNYAFDGKIFSIGNLKHKESGVQAKDGYGLRVTANNIAETFKIPETMAQAA